MTDAVIWRTLREKFAPFGRLTPTTRAGKDIPDCAYTLAMPGQERSTSGWIELKWARVFPARLTTKVELSHPLTLGQVLWIEEEVAARGRAFVLLQVARAFFLFDAVGARKLYGGLTGEEMHGFSVARKAVGFPTRTILEELTR